MPERIVRLRAGPAVGIGGMYATGLSVDDVVRTAPMVPSVAHQQIVSQLAEYGIQ